ncbi:MAG: hypothetical protein M3R01_01595, partial [Actinomycetota bacterium]|nr:hypothetical protein [Actinomycetota bacterium]
MSRCRRALVVVATAVALAACTPSVGSISTVAGTGNAGYSGNGGPATAADLNLPRGIDDLADGSFLVAEANNDVVRRVWPDGRITRVAGTGTAGYSGDGGSATSARLNFVHSVSVTPDGGFLIADTSNDRIRYVSPAGIISTVAGNGVGGFSGDGGPATAARLADPRSVAALPDGGFLIPDTNNRRVRRVSPSGVITTVAGTGALGSDGDGGPATSASLGLPFSVSPAADGGFYVADNGSHRIRHVSAGGKITRVAGTTSGFSGDGGAATAAKINGPHNVQALPGGGFLISDRGNHRVRRVDSSGTITSIVGTG